MAKIYGLFGAMTGKLADVVMAVRNGEQVARKYQPVVFNPSTLAQVAQRAKLKLMSQLSAVLAPIIAFRKKGSVSARNLFTASNIRKATYAADKANVTLSDIDLTGSHVFLPFLAPGGSAGSPLSVSLTAAAPDLARVMYALCQIDGAELRLLEYDFEETAGAGNTFAHTFSTNAVAGAQYVVYAFGVRDNTEAARARFEDMKVSSGAGYPAFVEVLRTLTESDITLTETRGDIVSIAAQGAKSK